MTRLRREPAPPLPQGAVPGTEAATRLLADLRTEISRADSKAAVVVAALGMSAGVISAVLVSQDWTPDRLARPGAYLWWGGATLLTAALLSLSLVVLPRYRVRAWSPGAPLTYFGDIQQAVRLGRLPEALAETEQLPMTALLAALTETSRIATRKHQWIRAGLIAFWLGALMFPVALAIG
ncbi:Pycsar system effector family protein [Streptomyces sp. NPDC006516]|uniref:Pycsar system effector family protein n=1 Tax=Streptomyces sp. NPDC006516 TaxID=3154309 RepID=UPI0033A17374